MQPRPVTLETSKKTLAIIRKGVQEGEVVVTEGQNQLPRQQGLHPAARRTG